MTENPLSCDLDPGALVFPLSRLSLYQLLYVVGVCTYKLAAIRVVLVLRVFFSLEFAFSHDSLDSITNSFSNSARQPRPSNSGIISRGVLPFIFTGNLGLHVRLLRPLGHYTVPCPDMHQTRLVTFFRHFRLVSGAFVVEVSQQIRSVFSWSKFVFRC